MRRSCWCFVVAAGSWRSPRSFASALAASTSWSSTSARLRSPAASRRGYRSRSPKKTFGQRLEADRLRLREHEPCACARRPRRDRLRGSLLRLHASGQFENEPKKALAEQQYLL